MANDDTRFKGIIETVANTRARNASEFTMQEPSASVLERMKAEGLTWRSAGMRGGRERIIVTIPTPDPTIDRVPEVQTTP